ncbi:hypothetical protein OAQ84_01195 [Bdellovibrionales bacterium]|nr:hypothetical protein [Bdellovibrionales bacterium]
MNFKSRTSCGQRGGELPPQFVRKTSKINLHLSIFSFFATLLLWTTPSWSSDCDTSLLKRPLPEQKASKKPESLIPLLNRESLTTEELQSLADFLTSTKEALLSDHPRDGLFADDVAHSIVHILAKNKVPFEDNQIKTLAEIISPLTPMNIEIIPLFEEIVSLANIKSRSKISKQRRTRLLEFISHLTFYDFYRLQQDKSIRDGKVWQFFELLDQIMKFEEFDYKKMKPFFISMIRGTDRVDSQIVIMALLQKNPKMFSELGQPLFDEISKYKISQLKTDAVYYVLFLLKAEKMGLKIRPGYILAVNQSIAKTDHKLEDFLKESPIYQEIWHSEFRDAESIRADLNQLVQKVIDRNWSYDLLDGNINEFAIFLRDLNGSHMSVIDQIFPEVFPKRFLVNLAETTYVKDSEEGLLSEQRSYLSDVRNFIVERYPLFSPQFSDMPIHQFQLSSFFEFLIQNEPIFIKNTSIPRSSQSMSYTLVTTHRIVSELFHTKPLPYSYSRNSILKEEEFFYRSRYMSIMRKNLLENQSSDLYPSYNREEPNR